MFQSLHSPFNSFRRYLEGSSSQAGFAEKAQLSNPKGALTHSDVNEALQLRQALEPLVMELVMPRVSRKQLAELDALIERHGQLAGNPRAGAMFMELDKRFHLYLADLAGNRRLAAIIRAVWDLQVRTGSEPFQAPGHMEILSRDHARIVEAIRNADCAAAKELTVRHIDRAYDEYAKELAPKNKKSEPEQPE